MCYIGERNYKGQLSVPVVVRCFQRKFSQDPDLTSCIKLNEEWSKVG